MLLGDQLIRDPGIAVFELVKNAYDADASAVTVTMSDLENPGAAQIVVKDDGTGMDWKHVTEVWLEPGTDYRQKQRAVGTRSERFKRLPIGEKGVGRFAAHKLGMKVQLVTRASACDEVVVDIDWDQLESARYLSDAKVSVFEREPRVFRGKRTGTRIEVSNLRQIWTRGMVRDLARSIMSITSPFAGVDAFRPKLVVDPPEWLEGLTDPQAVLESALFRFSCHMEDDHLAYTYEFRPLPGMRAVEGRFESRDMKLPPELDLGWEPEEFGGEQVRIGPVDLELYIFDLDPQLSYFGLGDKAGLRRYLKENGGVRVYREDIRVYDYGEPGNDWLGLGTRRVNRPTEKVSNNLIIGAVSLNLADSQDLVEKTNREGFVENGAYAVFRQAVLFALQQAEAERNIDKLRIRQAYGKMSGREPVVEELARLRSELEHLDADHKAIAELIRSVNRIDEQYRDVRDRLLTAAGAGLGLAVVIHEVEKGVLELNKAVDREVSIDRLRDLAHHLSELIEGLTYLTRQSGFSQEKASRLIRQAVFNTEYRLRYHNISVVNGITDLNEKDLTLTCSRRLVISTLMNLIDNAIYWISNRRGHKRRIYIGTTTDLGGQAIVVADTGSGFSDPPDYLTQPFFSRKKEGMGLGLHLASMVMQMHDRGRLVFPQPGDLRLPHGFDGAVVALVFGGSAN
ncbi:MAG TPA: sensor histidine kinase [Symbiobacteriaceae bacterium]|nr:sensor histidine kinase [Symbiobacteriaceae bacterium]